MSEWRDIESAPKDGTHVWLAWHDTPLDVNDVGHFEDGEWWIDGGCVTAPDFWMPPIPPLPATNQENKTDDK